MSAGGPGAGKEPSVIGVRCEAPKGPQHKPPEQRIAIKRAPTKSLFTMSDGKFFNII